MTINYYDKYLKYKNKYLQLKAQLGGDSMQDDICSCKHAELSILNNKCPAKQKGTPDTFCGVKEGSKLKCRRCGQLFEKHKQENKYKDNASFEAIRKDWRNKC